MSEVYAPNQQHVRGDSSGPAEEGDGGSPPQEGDGGTEAQPKEPDETQETQDNPDDLDSKTKDELIEIAQSRGLSPANAGMTKDELKAVIEAG